MSAAAISSERSSRWWFGSSPWALEQAKTIVDEHRESLTGCYFYFGFHIDKNGSFSSPPPSFVAGALAPFRERGLTVGVALGLNQDAVQSGTVLSAVAAIAAAAKAANISSIMIDYEPVSNYTREHAEAYASLITRLSKAMHENSQTLEICVSSWSILTEFRCALGSGCPASM